MDKFKLINKLFDKDLTINNCEELEKDLEKHKKLL